MSEWESLQCPVCGDGARLEVRTVGVGYIKYRCNACGNVWPAVETEDDVKEGLRPDKYKVFDQHGCAITSFVLRFNQDPAARVALRAYAMATNNGVLARDLDALLNKIARRPEDYPIQGSEGILNRNVSARHFESSDSSVLVIFKKEDDE